MNTHSPFELIEGLPSDTGFCHRFVLRNPSIPVDGERDEVIARLSPCHMDHVRAMGFAENQLCIGEQVHGAEVAIVEAPLKGVWPKVDGFVSRSSEVVLGIYVADCCAVYLIDASTGVFGLVHSGKKGSEQGIVRNAITAMCALGSRVENIHVALSPCIRPPAYDVDFASMIVADCARMGVPSGQVHDGGTCTSSDLTRYYSYRVEKGRTGRMLALLGRSRDTCA